MRQVRVAEERVPTAEPHVVRKGVLTHERLGGAERGEAILAREHGLITRRLGFVHAPLVKQHQFPLLAADVSGRGFGSTNVQCGIYAAMFNPFTPERSWGAPV